MIDPRMTVTDVDGIDEAAVVVVLLDVGSPS